MEIQKQASHRVPLLIGGFWLLAVLGLLALWQLESDGELSLVYLRLSLVAGVAFPILAGGFTAVFRWLLPEETHRSDGHDKSI
ncbi:MAG: hypothetical protein KKC79_11015 [Gammaproteobacteria bacterium]|nr:hypothetical protein [Gammaproteobacteria bacterium]MBU1441608.1 hypothetical protein [Gammaproteobacteria bacterium]MBU2288373.1 hypothetical protein [Gammaproteobacteria bacterium]MBU2409159.1 hypothetical protein [Gammaproteobacteria bacterium]